MRQRFHHEVLEEYEGKIDFAPKGKGKEYFLRDLRALCGENICRDVPVANKQQLLRVGARCEKSFRHDEDYADRTTGI